MLRSAKNVADVIGVHVQCMIDQEEQIFFLSNRKAVKELKHLVVADLACDGVLFVRHPKKTAGVHVQCNDHVY
jgi:hypothetical protein